MAVRICFYYTAMISFTNPLSAQKKNLPLHFDIQSVQAKVIEIKSIISPCLKSHYLSLLLHVILKFLVIKIILLLEFYYTFS